MPIKRDKQIVPRNYEELYIHYIMGGDSLCRAILRSKLPKFQEEDREALAHEVYIRLQRHQALERFDSTKGDFGGMVFSATRSVISNWMRTREHDALGSKLNAGSLVSAREDNEFEPGTISLETLFGVDPRMEERLQAEGRVGKMADYVRRCMANPQHKRDRSMGVLFRMLWLGCEPNECAAELGVTNSTIHNWMGVLRLQADM